VPSAIGSDSAGTQGERLAVEFIGGKEATPAIYASDVQLGMGGHGEASIIISIGDGQTSQNATALFLSKTTVEELKAKYGSLVKVSRCYADTNDAAQKETVFLGQILDLEFGKDEESDSIIIIANGGSNELSNVRIVGAWVFEGAQSEYVTDPQVKYCSGVPAWFNPGGRPNMIWYEDKPWFAPHPDYNLKSNAPSVSDPSQPPQGGAGERVATYWTLKTILAYLRNTVGPGGTNNEDLLEKFPALGAWPAWIEWPESFGSGLDSDSQANFNSATGQNNSATGEARKGRDINLNGLYLAGDGGEPGAFDALFEAAGGWSWYLAPGEQTVELTAVPSRYLSEGVEMPYAAGGSASSTLANAVITAGRFRESARNYKTKGMISGGIVKGETRLSSRAADHGGGTRTLQESNGTGTPGWVAGWSAERFALWKKLAGGLDITLNGETIVGKGHCGPATVAQANAIFPEVISMLQLCPAFDFTLLTDFSQHPRARITRPLWPTLLSFVGGAGSLGPTDGKTVPYPISFEIRGASGEWVKGPTFEGLEILDNGCIHVPLLRDPNLPESFRLWRHEDPNAPYDTDANGIKITLNDIRATVVIPFDHRFAFTMRTAADKFAKKADSTFFDVADGSPDEDKLDPDFTRMHYIDAGALYQLWYRSSSYPRPESDGGTTGGQEFFNVVSATSGTQLRNDRQLMRSHIKRAMAEHARLRGGGYVEWSGYFVTNYPPGTQVEKFVGVGGGSDYMARRVVSMVQYFSERAVDKNGVRTRRNGTRHHFA